MESRPKMLLDQVRDAIRVKHYARNTEQSYVYWIKKYILFHNKRHPKDMGAGEVRAFLTHLALEEHISASTQNQVLRTLLFLYHNVLKLELGPVDSVHASHACLPALLPFLRELQRFNIASHPATSVACYLAA